MSVPRLAVFWRSLFVSIWTYIALRQCPYWFLLLTVMNLVLYLLALYVLSLAAAYTSKLTLAAERRRGSDGSLCSKEVTACFVPQYLVDGTRVIGIISGISTLALAFFFPPADALQVCNFRSTSFFFAHKIWYLCLTTAHHPPVLFDRQHSGGPPRPVSLTLFKSRLYYIWMLLTELRYASFDIGVTSARTRPPFASLSTFTPFLFHPLMFLVPLPEIKILAMIHQIYICLEGYHRILHTSCPNSQFWYPFAAPSMNAFWRVHWHQAAFPWLYGLAYTAGELAGNKISGSKTGKAFGVLATFHLSGIWHMWIVMPFSNRPIRDGIGLWMVFMVQGVWILLEKAIWGERLGKLWWQALLSWVILVESGAMWLRYADFWFGPYSMYVYALNIISDVGWVWQKS